MRGIDNIRKSRGESTHDMSSLRMKSGQESKVGTPPPAISASLKLK
jgi:hypothetical protein